MAFGAYFCMYAFRKPFAVATFEGLSYWGVDYKILLIISQVLGYMLSKFIGVKVISELRPEQRLKLFLTLILAAEAALLSFALLPSPFNIVSLFFNGLPLGMIWGIVFSYLEGRTSSEILGAGLSASFIVASGAVKSVGQFLMINWKVSEFYMPFVVGLLFLPPLFLFAFLLDKVPPPTAKDEALRTKRRPMDGKARKKLFREFGLGIVLLTAFYTALTAYRDFRDNFAAELWQELGYADAPSIFTVSEIPIAFIVLITMGLTMYIRNNQKAFWTYHGLILSGVLLIGLSTFLFQTGRLHPALWMILIGLGLYLAYVPFNCILFDRMLAAFHYVGTAGFLIYIADSFGYLGSVFMLFYKNFGAADLSWSYFMVLFSYFMAIACLFLGFASLIYFRRKAKVLK